MKNTMSIRPNQAMICASSHPLEQDQPAWIPSQRAESRLGRMVGILAAAVFLTGTCVKAASVFEVEGNDSPAMAQFVSPFSFTSEFVPDIELSTTYYHASIVASGDSSVDWFAISHLGGRLFFDVDGAMPNVDLEIGVWNVFGALVGSNDDQAIVDPGSEHVFDPFLDFPNQAAGLYYIGVSVFPSGQADNFDIGGTGFTTPSYTLHISSELVPEPTTAGLVLLSGLALLARRTRLRAE